MGRKGFDIFNSLALVVDVLRNIVIRCNCRATIVFVLSATNSDLLSVLIVDEMFIFNISFFEQKNPQKQKHENIFYLRSAPGALIRTDPVPTQTLTSMVPA